MVFKSIDQPGRSPEVERNPEISISFFGWRGVADGVQVNISISICIHQFPVQA